MFNIVGVSLDDILAWNIKQAGKQNKKVRLVTTEFFLELEEAAFLYNLSDEERFLCRFRRYKINNSGSACLSSVPDILN